MSSRVGLSMKGLVSLEGNTNIISIQLRLLPPSPKILILPPLSTVIQVPGEDEPFDVRAFIRHVHEAWSARLELARSFLQSSSCTQPRLIFMNGGTVSALTACIAVISEKVTGGNIQEAEELFNEIAKSGVAGLTRSGAIVIEDGRKNARAYTTGKGALFSESIKARPSSTTSHISHVSPSAIDAADFIDQLIDSLHKPLPNLPTNNQALNATGSEEHAKTTTTVVPPDIPRLKSRFWTEERIIPKTEQALKDLSRGRRLGTNGKKSSLDYLPYLQYPSRDSSTYTDAVMYQEGIESNVDNSSIRQERPASAPSSPGLTKENEYSYSYIEGRLTRHITKKAMSTDCIRLDDVQSTSLDIGPRKLKLGKFSPFTFSPLLMSENASITASDSSEISERSSVSGPLRRTAHGGNQETPNKNTAQMKTVSDEPPCVPDGLDISPRAFYASESTSEVSIKAPNIKEPTPFEPIFSMFEDFIIHIKDGSSNGLHETVIQSYKNGTYPVGENIVPQVPTTPTSSASIFSSNGTSLSGASHTSADSDDGWPQETAGIGPEEISARFLEEHSEISSEISSVISTENLSDSPSVYPSDEASIAPGNGLLPGRALSPKQENSGSTIYSILKPRLQIPVTNPEAPLPELVTNTVTKITELHNTSTINTVTLQDSIRGILRVRYPPETTYYKQHIFALENDRFWKPIFGMDARRGSEERTVDQIVALGYEDGVEKTLYKEVVEQLDKLGTSTTGVRASKLDIRFLVIYAMQTFTSQPLCLQAGENPFSQPTLLATLLIPHLETFLSSSCPTRLLILHYPASHLSTVLALRDLLGPHLLKIAGIIDLTAISPPNPSKERPNSIESIDEWVSTTTSQSPSPTKECRMSQTPRVLPQKGLISQPSFAKADFLLLSPAAEDEISTFLNSVWKSLTFPSASFFIPDDVLSTSSALHPLGSLSTASSHNAPPTPPPDRQISVARTEKRLSPTRGPKRVSFADSTASTDISTDNGRRRDKQSEKDWEKLESEKRERLSEKAWESFMMGNESDDSLLELERIFMPHLHFMPRTARRIGDSRKALKWLGLD